MAAPKTSPLATAPKIGLGWLVRLRWMAVFGQLAITALAVVALQVSLPLLTVLALIALTAASNLVVARWLERHEPSSRASMAVLVLDIATLTGLLLAAGGPSNPFSVFYLVHVALAALLLDSWRTWLLAALSSLAFGSLFLLPSHAIDAHARHMQHMASPLHLQGMWFAYTLAAGFVAHFVSRVANALRARERELLELQASVARTERLASLSTLAAGAAHELGTPLATIALVAKELEYRLERSDASSVSDARLIRQEVERCRDILLQMAGRAGEGTGEMPGTVAVRHVEQRLSEALGAMRAQVRFDSRDTERELLVPERLLVQVLTSLVKNAADAHAEVGCTEPIRVVSRIEERRAAFEILDRGVGISEQVRARIGEPFFTTKPPGQGLGLGVFLAREFAEKLGGELELCARPDGVGTVVRLTLPRDVVHEGSA
ncbi:MAG TPA: ATP-binding protein [Polyangiaceae bacterium]